MTWSWAIDLCFENESLLITKYFKIEISSLSLIIVCFVWKRCEDNLWSDSSATIVFMFVF